MGHWSSMFNGLARSFSIKKVKNSGNGVVGRETAESLAKDAKKNDLILRSSGIVNVGGSKNFASVCTRRGQKGVNQDCCIVWEVYTLLNNNAIYILFVGLKLFMISMYSNDCYYWWNNPPYDWDVICLFEYRLCCLMLVGFILSVGKK